MNVLKRREKMSIFITNNIEQECENLNLISMYTNIGYVKSTAKIMGGKIEIFADYVLVS